MAAAPEAINPSNFLGLWNRIQAAAQEQERSPQQIGYYSLGKETIAFRPVVESASDSNTAEKMTDIKGEKYLVSKTTAISSDDIDGILIEKGSSDGRVYYSLTVYFRKEAWSKIYSVSKALRKQRLALIKDRKVISVATVPDFFIEQAILGGLGLTVSEIENFSKGLLAKDLPSLEVRDREYANWSESYLENNPNDIDIMSRLVRYRSTKGYCNKAAELTERIAHIDPSRLDEAIHVLRCYKFSKRYGNVEAFLKQIPLRDQYSFLSRGLSDCLEIRSIMAEIYAEKGERQKAMDELEKSLSLLESAKVSIPPEMRLSLSGHDAENYLATMMNLKLWEIAVLKDKLEKLKDIMK